MIIGITGTLGAGKGTLTEFLKEKGFEHYSVRDFLIKEIKERGLDISQQNMASVANDLRSKFGASYIVEELYKRAFEKNRNVVIESLRCPGEVKALKGKKDFVLWAVDANIETRYSRIIEREGSAADEKRFSFDEFVEREQSQVRNNDPTKQNLSVCIEMADHRFRNDWTVGEFNGKVEKVLDFVNKKLENISEGSCDYVRPSWDKYFMEICRAVAKRGTCERGRSGCVIIKDKQILVTGYVGSPPGCEHCDDIGHQFKKTIHENGKVTNHCVRTTHAEQNAICQAAKLGIPLSGSTLYCFMTPCYVCAKSIAGAGIKRIVAMKDYHASKDSKDLFLEAGIRFELLSEDIQKYDNM